MSEIVRIVSFGYLHEPVPDYAHIVVDLRQHFRDPHVSPEMRELNGFDELVRTTVMQTKGMLDVVLSTACLARAFLDGASGGPVTVALGCAGGRHRSVVAANALEAVFSGDFRSADTFGMSYAAPIFAHRDIEVRLVHRDIDKGVVHRADA